MMDTELKTRESCLEVIWDSDRSRCRTFFSPSGTLWSTTAWLLATSVADPRISLPRDLEIEVRQMTINIQEAEATPLDREHFEDFYDFRTSIDPEKEWERDFTIQKHTAENKRSLLEQVLEKSDLAAWQKEVFLVQVVEGRRAVTCPHCACLHSVEFVSARNGEVFFLSIADPDESTSWAGLHQDHPQWAQLVHGVCWDCSIDGPPEVS